MKHRLLNILFWSVLSAAFIGPGTVTTAASAGAGFGYSLIWALVFSTFACVVLQEASARLTIVSGKNLGQVLKTFFSDSSVGKVLILLVPFSIIFGCAAYETGNILGGISGILLIFDNAAIWGTLLMGGGAALLLWFGSTEVIAQVMGGIVALMGLCFLSTAFIIGPEWGTVLQRSFVPELPPGSELIVLGLIGTTVVPYNIFLGSGLSHNQTLKEMRVSLTLAIVLGGIISIAVLIVSTNITGAFSFERLAQTLSDELGSWAGVFFAFGLMAAGFSSSLTAPLAASITAKSIWGGGNKKWEAKGMYYRLIWIGVICIGTLFGILQVQPIPAIILAQALNGIVLPLIAIFLFLMVNNAKLLGKQINSKPYNWAMGIVVFITLVIGVTNVLKAISRLFYPDLVNEGLTLVLSIAIAILIIWPLIKMIKRLRKTD
ncbi:NRAMP family divalent metal transporter [Rhodohalobacter sp. 614A]|uniref:NRAMP family divalent metal transporter n=1 Tax=Rhodohalobacter sp. 614A TaxID=2908649 RepID=UPI001F317EB0|nr:divalent metal cation transporter [Rhodohalobacter sp. 614A]